MNIWQIGCDLDGFLENGGSLSDLGLPATPAEHFKMQVAMGALPEAVRDARLARLARFCMLVCEAPCGSEGQLRERWAWAAAPLQ
jgi:hypothetical protein